jgi:cell division protease FtsH
MSDAPRPDSGAFRDELPAKRFRPGMLVFWVALVGAVLALLYLTPSMEHTPEVLVIQDVLLRAEAGHVKRGALIRPDPSGGRDWVVITGESRLEATSNFRPFRASGRDTEATHERLTRTGLFQEQPSQTLLTSILAQVIPFIIVILLLYFLFMRPFLRAMKIRRSEPPVREPPPPRGP